MLLLFILWLLLTSETRNLPLKFVKIVLVIAEIVFVFVVNVVNVAVVVDPKNLSWVKIWLVIDEMFLMLLLPSSAQLIPTSTQLVGLR